jgi:nitroimidazol reductase NimA-like FMN-containing flavoprotein (pyridoxamine 5'-phosphate oxidase superfamily)
MLTKSEIYEFIRARRFAVAATVDANGAPEAAFVGIAVTPELELVFETLDATRKCPNLRRDPRIAFVIGWSGDFLQNVGGDQSLQYEGVADEPKGEELERLLEIYFATQPEGLLRQGWPGQTYFRVRPRWIRLSDYDRPSRVEELTFP